MQCELCGRECKSCREVFIDKVSMMVCPDCSKHGQGAKQPTTNVSNNIARAISLKQKRSRPKDIYKNMEKEIVSNFSELIKDARKKKGLSREDLGFKIGERTVTISKIENGDLRPSDKMISKLEKELEITLMEEVKEIHTDKHSQSGLTLGDFIKTK